MVQFILAYYGTEYEYLHTCGDTKTDLVAEQRLPKVKAGWWMIAFIPTSFMMVFPIQDNYHIPVSQYLFAPLVLATSPARAKNGGAPGTHCLCMHLISPRCGDSGLFSDSSALCDVRVWTWYSILVRIICILACNGSSDCTTATDLLNFVRPIIAVSLNFQLSACTSHTWAVVIVQRYIQQSAYRWC